MEMPELFKEEYSCNSVNAQFNLEKQHADINKNNSIDQFIIDDLLDFSNEDPILDNVSTNFDCFTGNSSLDSSIVTLVDNNNSTSNSSISGSHDQNFSTDFDRDFPIASFSDDLCVPYDDLAELEWVSNFVEESFSTEDLQKLQLISGIQTRTNEVSETGEEFQPESNGNNPTLDPELAVPGKARSKRPRATLNNWSSSRVLSPTTSSSGSDVGSVGSDSSGKKTIRVVMKKKEVFDVSPTRSGGGDVRDGRKCLHCATDKTPQWRTGPMGPKTLCNACGVRYKSGRLVPEYRPASSPTYVVTKHSNSHRKVIELRRQKEMQRSQYQQFLYPNPAFDESKCDDYLIHRHTESDFRQLI